MLDIIIITFFKKVLGKKGKKQIKRIEEKGVGIGENEKIDWWTNFSSPMKDLIRENGINTENLIVSNMSHKVTIYGSQSKGNNCQHNCLCLMYNIM